MTEELDALVEQLDEARAHVLATVDGLDEEQLTAVQAPVSWSILSWTSPSEFEASAERRS